MNILDGIKNFFAFINDNWTSIVIIIGLVVSIALKAKSYFSKSNEEKIEIAKEQISEIILKLVSDAEEDYAEISKAGSIKRSQVIDQIFADYPILAEFTNQDEIVKFIDKAIDNALVTLRDIISENNKED
ncbi:MAG: hypothetical protein NC177_17870 [Ruminococcus flavefaciens]|nr:hypothetical protein [Ruminococcus flavefaciens]